MLSINLAPNAESSVASLSGEIFLELPPLVGCHAAVAVLKLRSFLCLRGRFMLELRAGELPGIEPDKLAVGAFVNLECSRPSSLLLVHLPPATRTMQLARAVGTSTRERFLAKLPLRRLPAPVDSACAPSCRPDSRRIAHNGTPAALRNGCESGSPSREGSSS